MSMYTTNTSDKKKKTAIIFWAIGALGLLGLEYFYVGKIKTGAIRLLVGVFILALCFIAPDEGVPQLTTVLIVIWVIIALINLSQILFGKFKDNVGAPLRE